MKLKTCLLSLVLVHLVNCHSYSDISTNRVLLISFDGLRESSLDEYIAANPNSNFKKFMKSGIKAGMTPSFPSYTFPNHWTLVTG